MPNDLKIFTGSLSYNNFQSLYGEHQLLPWDKYKFTEASMIERKKEIVPFCTDKVKTIQHDFNSTNSNLVSKKKMKELRENPFILPFKNFSVIFQKEKLIHLYRFSRQSYMSDFSGKCDLQI